MTGIDRVCAAYLDRFADRSLAVVQYPRFRRILTAGASTALLRLLAGGRPGFRAALIRLGLASPPSLARSERGAGRIYLNLGHTGLDKPGFAEWTRSAGVRPVYFVHDLIPITHPHFCREGESARHRRRIRTMLATAAGIIGNSEDTLRILADFAKAEGMPMPPAMAALLGTPHLPLPPDPTPSPVPVFVALGTIEGRKNHALLLELWLRMIGEDVSPMPRLILVGRRGWQCDDVFALLDSHPELALHVEERPDCSDVQLGALLAGATALLFPSHVEGYGLPLAEALDVGTPVIASNLAVFREIADDRPDYVDPTDGDGWHRAVLDFAAPDSPRRAAQMARIAGYRAPTWDQHFAAVEAWLAAL